MVYIQGNKTRGEAIYHRHTLKIRGEEKEEKEGNLYKESAEMTSQ